MRASQVNTPAPIETATLKETEVPTRLPGVRDLLLRVQVCGLCHTDLHTVEGDLDLPKLPVIPGHQIVGIVEKAGNQVEQIAEGARTGVGWLNSTCGLCGYCSSDRENLCT